MLKIYNSLTNRKEEFTPIDPGKVRMYVCGMTVYDYCHLGHARVLVVFDVITRYLRERGFDVTYIRNITDIDDKIIDRANESGESFTDLTSRFIDAMNEDASALGVLSPDEEPRATLHMTQIVDMIQRLMDKGFAYIASNRDVYYDVSKFEHYGRLSGKRTEDLRAGARVEVDEAKDDAIDFVLWKSAKPGGPQWDSPWGPGRPGWHIECSAMSTHCLGDHFDIHGGGQDLQFPHHENEIAQSEAATGHKFVNLWMHNGFVRIDDEKMSKSLGNFFTIREILKQTPPEVVRYFILTSHYRSPLNYSAGSLENAASGLTRLYLALRGRSGGNGKAPEMTPYRQRFSQAMDDDFNTPEALAVLFDLVRDINRLQEQDNAVAADLAAGMTELAGVLGLLEQSPEVFLRKGQEKGLADDEIGDLIELREIARSNKDWSEADRIRNLLEESGVVLEDSTNGTRWRRV